MRGIIRRRGVLNLKHELGGFRTAAYIFPACVKLYRRTLHAAPEIEAALAVFFSNKPVCFIVFGILAV